ncbi:RNA chaperone Hfq [Anoxybacter fermentans]|uniref:RNA-binding protein Hfq n=1 Tax=Anoxybacter fermentans TaxID=1323375 RepID=A0A3Q9HPZ3_9FIRM|nr:RNA chaperone Hfq [Anoxybacter fermentans]AZR72795.1 RNA chaperone Hfq [Anoxybacter fermentans]
MKNQFNLQDSFLNQVRRDNIGVTIYLVNGFQLKGYVKGFDNFTIILDSDGRQQMVYKHAISTIIPQVKVENLFSRFENKEEKDTEK